MEMAVALGLDDMEVGVAGLSLMSQSVVERHLIENDLVSQYDTFVITRHNNS